MFRRFDSSTDRTLTFPRGARMNQTTIEAFTEAIAHGSKYTYQTLPRVLTIWLDMSEREDHDKNILRSITSKMDSAIKTSPIYKVTRVHIYKHQRFDRFGDF